jgi:3'(2'), 5'-bisphosphate nucleotidase
VIDILMPLISDVGQVGNLVYEKYRSDVRVSRKKDQSLVTNVDYLVHDELTRSLAHFFPDTPVISEEGVIPSYHQRKNMGHFWLLDPLDGTLDFINETDNFVISLGYISNNQPTMGILHHPVSSTTWVAIQKRGVFVQYHGGALQPLRPDVRRDEHIILVSAHRNDADLTRIIVRQREKELKKTVRVKPLGSALKLAYLADGRADEYLRFTEMKEWDFAGGHCLINEAGFEVFPLDVTQTLEYGTKNLCVPPMSIRKKIPIE